MRKYKLHIGFDSAIKMIDKDTFEEDTQKMFPFYQDGKQYAICPSCDNPIQLIGLYKELSNTDKPYGKHVGKSVKNLAEWHQVDYDFCPLSSHSRFRFNCEERVNVTEKMLNCYRLLSPQY